ncbi:acyl-CoA thioesterase [Desertibacillus haloalkaliphilus]|uniref:acyl-CoA thioesterase n=1 Tax=Desertibacillus haloalkaliphilus TaxID=1328930 RepID=UPI001C253F6E|nr:thioesterase family protein [Desertibacillus haloalkaliphilus]MBU8905646.1 acyl-CoA thioesterase [Desertibacillus haloalkaliphilus]
MIHETKVNVRMCETDALGHISNISYFIYLEQARIELFRMLGANTTSWDFILASTSCDFVQQGYFEQSIVVKTTVSKIGTKSFTIDHEVVDAKSETVIAHGKAVVVYFNFETQESELLPEDLKKKLNAYMF